MCDRCQRSGRKTSNVNGVRLCRGCFYRLKSLLHQQGGPSRSAVREERSRIAPSNQVRKVRAHQRKEWQV